MTTATTFTNRLGVQVMTSEFKAEHTLDVYELNFIVSATLVWPGNKDESKLNVVCSTNRNAKMPINEKDVIGQDKDGNTLLSANIGQYLNQVGVNSFTICSENGETSPYVLVIVYQHPKLPISTVSINYSYGKESAFFPQTEIPDFKNIDGALLLVGGSLENNQSFTILFGEEEDLRPILIEPLPTIHPFQVIETNLANVLALGQKKTLVSFPKDQASVHPFLTVLKVRNPEPILDIFQETDKEVVKVGGTLTYSVHIINRGTLTTDNLQFLTNIPEGTSLILESVMINNVQIFHDPSTPLYLRHMPIGDYLLVKYTVLVESLPVSGVLIHQPVLDYNFYPMHGVLYVGNQPCKNMITTPVSS